MMRLRQLKVDRACFTRGVKGEAERHRCTARKMCACSTRYRSLRSLILQRGSLRPPFDPPDQGLPPLDPTRRASPSGLPTGRCFTLRPPDRCFGSGFDQESLRALHGPPDRGSLRSSPGPPSTRRVPPWTCTRAVRPSTAAGLSRPCPTTNRQADWMRPSLRDLVGLLPAGFLRR
jgi:hypothetical protein